MTPAPKPSIVPFRGIYRERAFRNLPPHLRDRYFEPEGSRLACETNIHSRIKWGIANLIDEDQIAPLASADFIFCRNVFIYFSESAISRVVHSFARLIRPPGHLFVGAAESLLRLTTDFNLTEIDDAFVYVKRERRSTNGALMDRVLRVVVIDDSAYVRKVVREICLAVPSSK